MGNTAFVHVRAHSARVHTLVRFCIVHCVYMCVCVRVCMWCGMYVVYVMFVVCGVCMFNEVSSISIGWASGSR